MKYGGIGLKEQICGSGLMYDKSQKICNEESIVIQNQPECSQTSKHTKDETSNLVLLLKEASSLSKELSLDFINSEELSQYSIKFSSYASMFEKIAQGKIDEAVLSSIRDNANLYFEFTRLLSKQNSSYSWSTSKKIEQLRRVLNGLLHEVGTTNSGSKDITSSQNNLMTASKELLNIKNSLITLAEDPSSQYIMSDITGHITSLFSISNELNEILYLTYQPTFDKESIVKRLIDIKSILKNIRIEDYGSTSLTNSYNIIITSFEQITPDLNVNLLQPESTLVGTACDFLKVHTPVPGDCQSFYHCSGAPGKPGRKATKKCGPGTLFNPIRMICDWPLNVYKIKPECKISPSKIIVQDSKSTTKMAETDNAATKTFETATTSVPGHEALIQASGDECDVSLINTIYPGDCQAFYHCVGAPGSPGKAVKKKCGPGTIFNPFSLICDWPSNVYKIRPECNPANLVESTTRLVDETTAGVREGKHISLSTSNPNIAGGLLFTIAKLGDKESTGIEASTRGVFTEEATTGVQEVKNFSTSTSNPNIAGGLLFTIAKLGDSSSSTLSSTTLIGQESTEAESSTRGVFTEEATTGVQEVTNFSSSTPNPNIAGGLLFTIAKIGDSSSSTLSTTKLGERENFEIESSTRGVFTEGATTSETIADIVTEDSILLVQSTKSPPLACPKNG